MSDILFRCCCDGKKQYIAHFTHGLPVLFCKSHFADKSLLVGAKKVYDLETKQEIAS